MIAPMAYSGVAHILWECIELRHLGHRPMERGVEAGDLRQTRERLCQRPRTAHVEGLMGGLHRRQRVEVVEHVAIDQDRRFETGAAEHDAVAGCHHLHGGDVGFQPGDDEMQGGPVVDRVAFAPLVRVQRLAGWITCDEVRVVLHVVDLAAAEQR